jgi:hypothetical protein
MDEGVAEKEEAGLDLPAPTGPIEDFSWLEGTRIEAGGDAARLTGAVDRATAMQHGARGIKNKMWHCDGYFVYFRRKMATTPMPGAPEGLNPHLARRHNEMIARGDYRHVATQDDVEIYELADSSPFKRRGVDLGALNLSQVRWYAIWAAIGRFPGQIEIRPPDWTLFVDCLEEMASRIKGAFHKDEASWQYTQEYNYTIHLIQQAGGPSPGMIDYGVQSVMKKRGQSKGRVIMLPPT